MPPSAGPVARRVAPDLVRVIGTLGIVSRHTFQDPSGRVSLIVTPWVVAAFLVVSGYLWDPHKRLSDEIDGRARTLLMPYLWWSALIAVPYFIYAYSEYGAAWATRLLAALLYG